MKIKSDWLEWLHNYRRREVGSIFSKCPKKVFTNGLELGAGDGFQSTLLSKYINKLVSTDINPDRLKKQNARPINYRICDAEVLDKTFDKKKFDIVFSSSLLEHVPNPQKVLKGIHNVMKDDGITINIIPNPFWKLCHVLLHIPNQIVRAVEILTGKGSRNKTIEERKARDNNPKIRRAKRTFISRFFMPEPHGVSQNNIKEFHAFSKERWVKEFNKANFDIIAILKAPVASGYGFGLDSVRKVLEKIGFTSEYVYISVKKGKKSLYAKYFTDIASIAFILSQFPETHETFILREMMAMKEAGINFKIFSLKPCKDKVIHDDAKAFMSEVDYTPLLLGWRVVSSNFMTFIRNPIKYIGVLLEIVYKHMRLLRSLRSLAMTGDSLWKSLVVFPKSVYYARKIKKIGAKHIHAHWATIPATSAYITSRFSGVPYGITAHAWDIFVKTPMLKEKLRKARFVITCTDYNRRYLINELGLPESKVFLNYHGLEKSWFDEGAQNLKPRTQNLIRILAIGRLVEQKGFEYLIKACGILKKKGIDFECNIVGEGPLRQRLASCVLRLALENNVKFLGTLGQDRIKKLYHEASMLVAPSVIAKNGDRDGIPNVVLEAMAMGLPVVATDVSGLPEVVLHGKTGIVAKERDAVSLSQAIERLINNEHLRIGLAEQGKRYVSEYFDLTKNVQKLIQIFDKNARRTTQYAQRIKLLYVIWSLEPGGAERVVVNLAKGFDKTKYDPIVCCLNEKGEFANELEKEGIKVIALRKRGKFDISVIFKLISVIRNNNIDIIHAHLWGANFWGRIAGWLTGRKVVITEHNIDEWKTKFHFLCDRILTRFTSRIITVSNKVKEFYVEKAGLPAAKVGVVYNGVASPRQVGARNDVRTPLKKEFGIKNDEIVLAVIGRLVEQKGHRYLFEALKLLDKRYKIKLLVVGDGPLKNRLQTTDYRPQTQCKVVFTGLRKDVPNILSITDILVMPSLREGFPMVALEAMAQGVPVIATDVGGVKEVVKSNETGLVVAPKSIIALGQALEKLMSDKALRKMMGEKCKERVKNYFRIEKMLCNHQNIYEEVGA